MDSSVRRTEALRIFRRRRQASIECRIRWSGWNLDSDSMTNKEGSADGCTWKNLPKMAVATPDLATAGFLEPSKHLPACVEIRKPHFHEIDAKLRRVVHADEMRTIECPQSCLVDERNSRNFLTKQGEPNQDIEYAPNGHTSVSNFSIRLKWVRCVFSHVHQDRNQTHLSNFANVSAPTF